LQPIFKDVRGVFILHLLQCQFHISNILDLVA
jgi:hypothetical protein